MEELFNMLFRFGHILVGITWIGLLYYFNFIQTEYFKEAEEDARKDAVAKLAPRALWWFRWAAFLTFLTGLALLHYISVKNYLRDYSRGNNGYSHDAERLGHNLA